MIQGKGWARRVTIETLPEFRAFLRQNEPQKPKMLRGAEEGKKSGESPFRGVRFLTSKRFKSGKVKVVAGSEPRPTARKRTPNEGAASSVLQPLRGFWKVLSKWDTHRKSAPGQIQIPIQFKDMFPPLKQTKPADEGGRGRQWETTFQVSFRDGTFTASAAGARFIVYEPATGHPRQNTECRFTFHDNNIFHRLVAGDILSFHFDSTHAMVFIERIRRQTKAYRRLTLGKSRWEAFTKTLR